MFNLIALFFLFFSFFSLFYILELFLHFLDSSFSFSIPEPFYFCNVKANGPWTYNKMFKFLCSCKCVFKTKQNQRMYNFLYECGQSKSSSGSFCFPEVLFSHLAFWNLVLVPFSFVLILGRPGISFLLLCADFGQTWY